MNGMIYILSLFLLTIVGCGTSNLTTNQPNDLQQATTKITNSGSQLWNLTVALWGYQSIKGHWPSDANTLYSFIPEEAGNIFDPEKYEKLEFHEQDDGTLFVAYTFKCNSPSDSLSGTMNISPNKQLNNSNQGMELTR